MCLEFANIHFIYSVSSTVSNPKNIFSMILMLSVVFGQHTIEGMYSKGAKGNSRMITGFIEIYSMKFVEIQM